VVASACNDCRGRLAAMLGTCAWCNSGDPAGDHEQEAAQVVAVDDDDGYLQKAGVVASEAIAGAEGAVEECGTAMNFKESDEQGAMTMMSGKNQVVNESMTTIDSTKSRDRSRMVTMSTSRSIRGEKSLKKSSSGDFTDMETALLTFEGQLSLCRGTPLTEVMWYCGRIFSNSAGCASTYAKSSPTSTIDTFISHNWAIGRLLKWMTIAWHFNFTFALWMTQACAICIYIAMAVDVFPWHTECERLDFVRRRALLPFLVGPLFTILVLFGHSFKRLIGMPDPLVFLDKTCIHQTDKEIQRAGIIKLGAFLRKSKHMLVIYTPLYWQKLWTVYEYASFLALRGGPEMTRQQKRDSPITRTNARAVFVGFVVCAYYWLAAWRDYFQSMGNPPTEDSGARFFFLGDTLWWGIFSFMCSFFWLRNLARQQWHAAMHHESLFSVDGLKCFCEDDRIVVYANICGLMRASGWAEEDADDSDALFAFEKLMESTLHRTEKDESDEEFQSSALVPPEVWVAFFFLVRFPFQMDVILAPQPDYGFELWRFRIGKILFLFMEGCGLYPTVIFLLCMWMQFFAYKKGFFEVGWVVLGNILAAIPFALTRLLDPVTVEDHSNIALCKLLGWTVFWTILAKLVFLLTIKQKRWMGKKYGKMLSKAISTL